MSDSWCNVAGHAARSIIWLDFSESVSFVSEAGKLTRSIDSSTFTFHFKRQRDFFRGRHSVDMCHVMALGEKQQLLETG